MISSVVIHSVKRFLFKLCLIIAEKRRETNKLWRMMMKAPHLLIFALVLLNGCIFGKNNTTKIVKDDNSTNTNQTNSPSSTPSPSPSPSPSPTPTPTPTTPTTLIAPHTFLITGHGKGYYPNYIVWSSKTDPALTSVASQSKFNTDYRLKVRIKALDRPQAGYQTALVDNYGNSCQRNDYAYTKIKVLVGIRAIGSSYYLERKYLEANVNDYSQIVEFSPPSSSNFIVDILELKNDTWCKIYTDSGDQDSATRMGYCPFAEETSFTCSQLELELATDWTTDFN